MPKCTIEPHLAIPRLTCEQHRDIYLEAEEDALNKAGDALWERTKKEPVLREMMKEAKKLLTDPKWREGEVHDMALRRGFTEEQKGRLRDFLTEYSK